jgi:hypothetical protein
MCGSIKKVFQASLTTELLMGFTPTLALLTPGHLLLYAHEFLKQRVTDTTLQKYTTSADQWGLLFKPIIYLLRVSGVHIDSLLVEIMAGCVNLPNNKKEIYDLYFPAFPPGSKILFHPIPFQHEEEILGFIKEGESEFANKYPRCYTLNILWARYLCGTIWNDKEDTDVIIARRQNFLYLLESAARGGKKKKLLSLPPAPSSSSSSSSSTSNMNTTNINKTNEVEIKDWDRHDIELAFSTLNLFSNLTKNLS